ncbi:MAG TPA: helix-hairpin-helix domain-containing protein [Microvirga sp.]|nr:helix-hairpin-helix domain-containing protein [Microvirga sp.]
MRNGDGSRHRSPAGRWGGILARTMLAASVLAVSLAGWQVLSLRHAEEPVAPSGALARPAREPAAREPAAPVPAASLAADAGAGPSEASPVRSPPPSPEPVAPARLAFAPGPASAPLRGAGRGPTERAPAGGGAGSAAAALDAVPRAGADASGRSGPARGLVDLNTAELHELNALRGGGRIGRAIIRARPYASPEDLLRKRVLSRSTYERVKDQVTVR